MITEEFKEKLTQAINKGGWGKENAKEAIPLIENYIKQLTITDVSFSLRDKFAMKAMNGELSAQNFETGEHWANEKALAQRAYLIADAMLKERSIV